MTAPEARPGGIDTNVRGLLVLGAALAVGFLLLLTWGPSGGDGDSAADPSGSTTIATDLGDDTTTTAADATTTSSVPAGRSPSEVSVTVLNGGGPTGAASTNSATIGEGGYVMGTPGNAPTVTATTIYYTADYQAEAIAVAALLGKNTDSVKPIEDANLAGAGGDADVVVVIGPDAPPTSGTTTTVAGGTGSTTTTTG